MGSEEITYILHSLNTNHFGHSLESCSAVALRPYAEHLAGDTVSEKDVRIKHTRSKDVVWFYGSIVGAPLFVLGLGLFSVSWRRRRQRRQS